MTRFYAGMLLLALAELLVPAFGADLQPPTAIIPPSYFGMHIHHLSYPSPTTPWPAMTVPEWRLWDAAVRWPELEPEKGHWQFARLDSYVSLAQSHGTGMLLPLGMTPQWASGRPQLTAPPQNLDDWRTYVKTVVTRYKGRIEAYEIWNEPNLSDFWIGNTDQLVTLTKEAAAIIHATDPQAVVVSPAPTADFGIPWFIEFLKKGGAQSADVIGYHFYGNPNSAPPEAMVPVIQRVRQIMTENGVGAKPLWNTETGWLVPPPVESEEAGAGILARAYIVTWAAGVQRFYWYAWDNRSLAIVTYREEEHRVTAAGKAYGVVQHWLVGTTMGNCSESAEHTWTCPLDRAGKKEWAVWNSQGKRKFDVPDSWHVRGMEELLQDGRSVIAKSIDVGPLPVLLKGHS